MIVVSNAGPLIALARIGHLSLLHRLYGGLLIPSAVQAEVTRARPDSPGAREVDLAAWITVFSVSDQFALNLLRERLDFR